MREETTLDSLFGGRVVLAQPARGYRVNVDALLLAAEDSARSCERAGGTPDYDPRRVRGVCDADWHQDSSGGLRFSCRASVTVRCR